MSIISERVRRQGEAAIHSETRVEAARTNYAAECRLAGGIVRGEEIRRRLSLLQFYLDQDWHDLWQACRWADRIELCERRLAGDREEIRRLWRDLWQRVAEALLDGEEVTALDRFFFLARTYAEPVLAGALTFAELEAGYDWLREGFVPDFAARVGQKVSAGNTDVITGKA